MKTESQTQRIWDAFLANEGKELSLAELNKIGSGKPNGWVSSMTRRISDCRERAANLGCKIGSPRIVIAEDGTKHSFYRLTKTEVLATLPPVSEKEVASFV